MGTFGGRTRSPKLAARLRRVVPLLVLADLQGNRWALEAILGHAKRRVPDADVVLLGNAVGAGPDPAGTVDLLRKRGVVLVKGPRDEAALGLAKDPALRLEGDANARALSTADLAYLRAASPPRRLMVHGERLLLTSDPRAAPGVERLVQPGDACTVDARRIRIASAGAPTGEAPFLVLDDDGWRVGLAAWDVDAYRRPVVRTRHR
jgi:hypothetical protein